MLFQTRVIFQRLRSADPANIAQIKERWFPASAVLLLFALSALRLLNIILYSQSPVNAGGGV